MDLGSIYYETYVKVDEVRNYGEFEVKLGYYGPVTFVLTNCSCDLYATREDAEKAIAECRDGYKQMLEKKMEKLNNPHVRHKEDNDDESTY